MTASLLYGGNSTSKKQVCAMGSVESLVPCLTRLDSLNLRVLPQRPAAGRRVRPQQNLRNSTRSSGVKLSNTFQKRCGKPKRSGVSQATRSAHTGSTHLNHRIRFLVNHVVGVFLHQP